MMKVCIVMSSGKRHLHVWDASVSRIYDVYDAYLRLSGIEAIEILEYHP